MTQSLGVIGNGILGKAIARGFMEMCEVRVFDLDKNRATHTLEQAATAGIVMIALPTPAKPDGHCDTSAITNFLDIAFIAGWWNENSCYVIRSTVNIGYTQAQAEESEFKVPLLHSPEFLTARCALTDFQTPARNIIGKPIRLIGEVGDDPGMLAMSKLHALYKERFPGVPIQVMPSNASELVKLACNSFFAAKVTFFNLVKELCDKSGVAFEDVRAGILSDGRIAHAHTQVLAPGGYGQACLPKDLADLFWCGIEAGVDVELLKAVHNRNVRTRGDDPGLAKIELP